MKLTQMSVLICAALLTLPASAAPQHSAPKSVKQSGSKQVAKQNTKSAVKSAETTKKSYTELAEYPSDRVDVVEAVSGFDELLALADSGNLEAQNQAADSYLLGMWRDVSVPKDAGKAIEWLSKAGEAGNLLAQYKLGKLYTQGKDTPQDYAAGRHWLALAAAQGDADSQYALGELYYQGLGGEKDAQAAFELWQQSADQEHKKAQYALGALFEAGDGVPMDKAAARHWYDKACTNRHIESCGKLSSLSFSIVSP